jgi:Fe-S cluster assembly ATP-binding protein
MLTIRNLHVAVEGKKILSGIDLEVKAGEVHAVMGPNASGKSTLAQVLAGHPAYTVLEGEVLFEGKNLLEMMPEDRAREGVFLAFQYPVEIPGVMNFHFLNTALNEIRKYRGLEKIDPMDFSKYLDEKIKLVEMDTNLVNRRLNEGFSGGEKKRNEILQMAVLEPKLAILDETDSGLDIDALKVVASAINKLRKPDNAIVLVTHYQRILNYISPDVVHVLMNGKIVRSGGSDLSHELEAKGYDWLRESVEV